MTKFVEAIFTNGVFQPTEALQLRDQQRVRLIVQTVDSACHSDRDEAFQRLNRGIREMDFHLAGPLPSRAELHDRL